MKIRMKPPKAQEVIKKIIENDERSQN